MKSRLVVPLFAILVLTSCMVAPTRGGGLQIVPILPTIVEVDSDDYYYTQGGYHYFYNNEHWYYSDSRNGQRSELPRSHWPRETRYRGRDHDRH